VRVKRAVLTAAPRAATEEEYSHAAGELEEALAALPGVLAVYKYGRIRVPGISDIDRLAVVENGQVVPNLWSTLSEQTRRLAMHTPVLVDPRTLVYHRWFAEAGDLTHICGERFDMQQRPHPEYGEPLIAAEALVITALKLAKLAVTRRVKVRPLLCELGNFKLDLDLARIERSQTPEAWSFADEVESLRNEWWDVDEGERDECVHDLLSRAPGSVDQAMLALATRVRVEKSPSLRLTGQWGNVTLVPEKRIGNGAHAAPHVLGYSRRLGEAFWRWTRRQVAVPEGLMTLLNGPPPTEYEEFRDERDDLVCRYARFLTSCPGYSAVGLATAFPASRSGH
jgi:hypothetical protein